MKAMSVCLVAAVVSCGKSQSHARAQKLAERANPVIEKLRAPVHVVLDPQADAKSVRTSCLEAIDTAAALGGAGVRDGFNAPKDRSDTSETLGVDDVLYAFSMQREVMCREDEGDGSRDARCRTWCVEMFTALADAIARAKDAAAKEDVTLQILRP